MGDFINQIYPLTSTTAMIKLDILAVLIHGGPFFGKPTSYDVLVPDIPSCEGLVQPVILSDVVVSVPIAPDPVSVFRSLTESYRVNI